MTSSDELKEIFDSVGKERKEMIPKYIKIMKKFFPQYLIDPKEKYAQLCDEFNEEIADILFKEDDKFDYRDPQCNKITSLFFDYLYKEKKGMSESNKKFIKKFGRVLSVYGLLDFLLNKDGNYRLPNYIDSKTIHFENEDIVITDPCYIVPDDKWAESEFGSNMEIFGITNYLTKDTLYGDWSCNAINTDTDKNIGWFCADAGLVSVMSLNDVAKINDLEKWSLNGCFALIKKFSGDVTIKVDYDKKYYDFYCYVEGKGSTNFITKQTGF